MLDIKETKGEYRKKPRVTRKGTIHQKNLKAKSSK